MTDWEVEALNEDEAFFHLKFIFSCFVNTFAFVLLLFLLKTLLYLFFKCLLFFGRRKETVCLTEPQDFSFFYIDNHKRQHA